MTRAEFERLVVEAIRLIPQRFRREMQNLALVVEEEPNAELLAEMEIEPPESLYGLYQGIPLPERTWEHGNALPDYITLFQRPIEADHEAEDEIRAAIGETLIHEVGQLLRGSAKRKSRRSRSGTGGVTRSAQMRTTSEEQEQVQWERVGLDIAVPSPPHIPACLSRPPERMWTDAACSRPPL